MKFKPVFKEKIWGGEKARTVLGMDFTPLTNCGEVWALSGVPECQTTIVNGFLQGNELNEILEVYMDELVGEKVFETNKSTFPLLIKFIDANDFLSIQVHPDDKLAARRGLERGKTEMWYILDAGPDSELISGFNRPLETSVYLDHFRRKRLKDILNFEKVARGDVFFMPAGRIHALGPGILLAEIQQTSDTTYRIYDWDRVDDKGKPRELHTDLALEAIDFTFHESYRTHYRSAMNRSVTLVDCPAFHTRLFAFDHAVRKDYSDLDSFVIYIGVEGRGWVKSGDEKLTISPGEVILLPATLETIELDTAGNCKILEVSSSS